MDIRKIGTYLLGAAMAVSVTGCKQGFKEVKNVEPELQKRVCALAQKTSEAINTKDYHLYGRDTLLLNSKFKFYPKGYIKEINDSAEAKAPARIIDSKLVHMHTPLGPMVKNHVIKEPVYKDTKAVVTPKLYTDGIRYYVPVEYWGK